MRSKALAVQSILEMTENRAKWRPVSGHSPSSHVRIGSQDRKVSGVVDDFAALYNPLENCGSLVIGGPPVWEQALGQREAAVTRFDSTKSTELPSTIAASRRALPARTGMATASSKRGSKRSDGDSPFYPLRLPRARSAAICRCRHSTLRFNFARDGDEPDYDESRQESR